MAKKLIRKVWIAVSAAALWGCGGASSYTAVDGVMLGTTLHITADVQGVSPQELYAAVMALPEKQAKRIYARYYLGMRVSEIAAAEGVDPSRVRDSIRRGLKQLAKYF